MKLLDERRKKIVFCTVLFGLLAHGYRLTNRFFCNDSYNYLTTISRSWTTAVGRFLLYLCETIRGGREVTWLIGCASIAFIALAAVLVVELYDIRHPAALTLTALIMVTNPTVAGTFGYMYTADGYFFGCLLAVLAAYLVVKLPGWKGVLLGAASLMVSLAFYQAYVSLTIMLLLILVMQRVLRKEVPAKEQWQEIGRYALMGIAAVVAYLILLAFARKVGGYESINYMGQEEAGGYSLHTIGWAIVNSYIEFARYLFVRWEWSFYSVANLILLGGIVLQLLVLVSRRGLWRQPLRLLALLFLGLSIPIVTHIFHFVSEGVNYITPPMSYSMCAVDLLPLCLLREEEEERRASKGGGMLGAYAVYLLLALIGINFIIFSNRVYESMQHANQQTENFILRLESTMERLEGYTEDAEVMVLGNHFQMPEYVDNGPLLFSAVSRIFLSGEGEYIRAMNWYLSTDYSGISEERKRAIVRTEEFAEMEEWPAQSSIRSIDGVIVIYLSDGGLRELLE